MGPAGGICDPPVRPHGRGAREGRLRNARQQLPRLGHSRHAAGPFLGYYVRRQRGLRLTMLISSGAELVIPTDCCLLCRFRGAGQGAVFSTTPSITESSRRSASNRPAKRGSRSCFLLETNTRPGLGVLLAYWLFGRGNARQSAPGAVIIPVFAAASTKSIFPYILARPVLIVAAIAGSAAGLLFFSLSDAGLVAPASPESILSVLAMAPKARRSSSSGRRDLRSRVAGRRRTLYPARVQDRNGRRSSRREAPLKAQRAYRRMQPDDPSAK